MAKVKNQSRALMNKSDLAVVMGVSPGTVDEWRRKGCPVEQTGGGGRAYTFNSAHVFRWRTQQIIDSAKGGDVADADALRRRKLAAQVEAAEMENARKRGELITIEDVVKVVAAEYASVRAKLLAIPAALAGALEGVNIGERRKRIEQSINEALTELGSSGPLTEQASDGEGGKPKTAARTNGKRVGGRT